MLFLKKIKINQKLQREGKEHSLIDIEHLAVEFTKHNNRKMANPLVEAAINHS